LPLPLASQGAGLTLIKAALCHFTNAKEPSLTVCEDFSLQQKCAEQWGAEATPRQPLSASP